MSAMSEAEFDRLLEAVTMAVATSAEDDLAHPAIYHRPLPKAANDNSLAWPLPRPGASSALAGCVILDQYRATTGVSEPKL
jgi:hypothetical protein